MEVVRQERESNVDSWSDIDRLDVRPSQNFDGEFSSADFVAVFTTAKYETGGAATWAEGDWNGDGVFNSSDFVAAFSGGGYEQGARDGGLQVVPEPSSALMAIAGLGLLLAVRRRR